MALVSVSKAASLVNRDRKVLYRDYIATGRLSVTKNGRGHIQLETSELLRVFGSFDTETMNRDKPPHGETPDVALRELEKLRQENAYLKEKLDAQAANLDDLRQALKMLEYKQAPKRRWWLF